MTELGRILRESRQQAGMTLDAASQRLPFDLRTIQRYENGETKCPLEALSIFAAAYHDTGLLYRVLPCMDPWQKTLPAFVPQSLPVSSLGWLNTMETLHCQQGEIIRIMADGTVDETEKEAWRRIKQGIESNIIACLQVLEATERSAAG